MRHMRRGEFEPAWKLSDAALEDASRRDGRLPRHLQSVWDGSPVAGRRVLVRCYHGLGDTIQFIRFAAPLRRIAAEVVVWAQPALLPLLRTAPGVDRLLPLHDGVPECGYDVDVEVMELPHLLRATVETLSRDVPYLDAPAAPVESPGFRVGLAWRAGAWNPRRDLPFELAARIARLPGVSAWSLQKEPLPGEAGGLVRWSPLARTVRGTARLMRGLDLVISVDSMPAHLAGALGVPVWTLVPQECDWRWMEGRDDSPWYPTMRLYRQRSPEKWAPAVERVIAGLQALAAGCRDTREAAAPPGGRSAAPHPRAAWRDALAVANTSE